MKKSLTGLGAVATIALTVHSEAMAQQNDESYSETLIAPTPSLQEELVYLRDIIAVQALRLDEAEQTLEAQNNVIEMQSEMIAQMQQMLGMPQTATAAVAPAAPARPPARAPQQAQSRTAQASADDQAKVDNATSQGPARERAQTTSADRPQPVRTAQTTTGSEPSNRQPQESDEVERVGMRPEDEDDRPYLAIFSDVGGILTPRGTIFVEPAVDYTVSSDNRFFFQGIEIVDAVLIGQIEATDSSRRAITESIGVRYGLTNRLEIDGRISYLQRDDRISGVAIDNAQTSLRDLEGDGIGDAEFGVHYQLNNGTKWPFVVANVRVKAPTGEGPFDVERDPMSLIDTELATGSGFWTVEPSATFILSSDPAVLFANVGYQFNLPTSPNQPIGPNTTLLDFNPGDAIRTSIGVGLSLNEKLSLNFGYDQSFFRRTSSIIETMTVMGPTFSESLQPTVTVGSFLFGGSYAVNDRLRLNLNTAIGATDEAADARVGIRAQYQLNK
ncbi:MAG: transporter [Pseudomonadota bacterium]